MKALSVKQPVGSLIKLGLKPIETRTWKTNYRGDILICGSLNWFRGYLRLPRRFTDEENVESYNLKGKAICIATLVDIKSMVKEDEKQACCAIYPGAYSWILENIRPIKPFPVKGKLSLFEVDDSLIQYYNINFK